MTSAKPPHILCIEDETELREDLVLELRDRGYAVSCAADGLEGLVLAQEQAFDLVVCDVQLQGLDGFALFEALRRDGGNSREAPFIFVTAYSRQLVTLPTGHPNIITHLLKPVDYDELTAIIAETLILQ
jgi:CheY-like chemotaxis protein